jgi:uncharacterized membrane protein (UPF0127 family)
MKSGWLLRNGAVIAAAEIADHPRDRLKGLLGRDGYDGAMVLPRTRSVHTCFMHFDLDVAMLDGEMTVVALQRVDRWRVCMPKKGGRSVLEAQAGAFDRWALAVGDRLEFREAE